VNAWGASNTRRTFSSLPLTYSRQAGGDWSLLLLVLLLSVAKSLAGVLLLLLLLLLLGIVARQLKSCPWTCQRRTQEEDMASKSEP
jgi:hypothetical protein